MSDSNNGIYLGLGTNLGDKLLNLEKALLALKREGVSVLAISKVYETEPVGFVSDDKFYNVAVKVEFDGSTQELLRLCLAIEFAMGRVRSLHGYTSRIIDIDILMFRNEEIDTSELKLPHPRIKDRLFVLLPLLEVLDNNNQKKVYEKVKSRFVDTEGIECLGDLIDIRKLF